jgi:hypothetical protein
MVPQYIDAVANLLGVIIWPLLVLVLLVTQREALAGLFRRFEELKIGNVAVKLRKELTERAQAAFSADPNAGKAPTDNQVEAAVEIEQLARNVDLSVVRRQALELAREYENTRAVLPAGDERTHKMEVIITKMRLLGLAAVPLLPELTSSASLGPRLAAIAILQVQPSSDYLHWLARRLAEDPGSFHGYHAAVALLSAARALGASQREALQNAINTARTSAREETKKADAFKVLDQAEREIQESRDIA